ncbi:hypothetical protein ACT2FY_24340 [Paraburkholderia fungorum]|uniref:hypothetical protein n=1 Tax=Paraburkholderia fungorum TaxID=134537 RepID=UPI00402B848C
MSDIIAGVKLVTSQDSSVPFPIRMLLHAGLEPDEINLDATFRETMDLAEFRRRLKKASDAENLPWHEVKKIVTLARVPSAFIRECIRTFGQEHLNGRAVRSITSLCFAYRPTQL